MSTDFEREIGSSMMPIENPSDIVENSKWIEEYRKRLAILLPEMTEAKKDFLEYAAKIFEVSQEELSTKAKKYLEESYLKDDNSYIKRQEARIERYSKSADYLKRAEEITDALLSKKISTYEEVDTDFAEIVSLMLDIKQTKASQQERKDTYLKKIEERDIMFAIKEMVIEQNPGYENEVESRLQAWEEQWGNINKLNNEAQSHGIPKELLETYDVQSEKFNPKKEISIKTRLTQNELPAIAAWKALRKETADMSYEDFCNVYVTERGHFIDPKELEDAWEGRNRFQNKTSGRQTYERLKKKWGKAHASVMLESRPIQLKKRDQAFNIISEVRFIAPDMIRAEIVKELMARLNMKYDSANRYVNLYNNCK